MVTRTFAINAILVLVGLALLICVAHGADLQHRRVLLGKSSEEKKSSSSSSSSSSESKSSSSSSDGTSSASVKGSGGSFDVSQNGAKADGKTDNAQAFMATWKAACASSSAATMVIPSGNFVVGPVVFAGPCAAKTITVNVQGTVTATTDLSDYSSPEWITFQNIGGLTITGKGTFDGKGSSAWPYNKGGGGDLPDNLRFFQVKGGDVSGITSLNSKAFHLHVVECSNINFHNLKFTAPGDSPNTDGIHISSSAGIKVVDTVIATGDDCVSVGQGVTNLEVTGVTCGPGHGISVGSLGKYSNEKDVSGITVSKCTLTKTTNGARIKTYHNSGASKASNIVFTDLTMNDVTNPVVIDQNYDTTSGSPSKVQLSDIHFRNIKGSSASKVAVTLDCSSAVPCSGVELANIALTYSGGTPTSTCTNAKVTTTGSVNVQACAA